MSGPIFCPRCGARQPAGSEAGLCPRCLLAHGIDGFADAAPAEGGPRDAGQPGAHPPLLSDFGDYELLEEIGRGGMGIVYRARQKGLNRIVALKIILAGRWASDAQVQRFRAEAEAAAALAHPHIVPIHETGELQGQHFFSMKLVEGCSLADALQLGDLRFTSRDVPETENARLARRNPDTVSLLAKIARAVHFAHKRGIVHRDLKPTNVLLDQEGEPHLTDFGLAKRLEGDSDLTRSQTILGTPAYMAPEQAAGSNDEVKTAADVYSLGAIFYETLTGQPPFIGRTPLDVLQQVRERSVRPPRALNPAVPRDLEIICLKCLQREPHRRYSSAADLADDLEAWLAGHPIRARAVTPPEKLWLWARRNPAAAGVGALVLVLVAGATVAAVRLRHESHRVRTAEADANEKRWTSYLSTAQAERFTGAIGRRSRSLEAIQAAGKIRPSLELRNEAIVALATLDLGPPEVWRVAETNLPTDSVLVSPQFTQYACFHGSGTITLHRAENPAVSARLESPPALPSQARFTPDGRWLAASYEDGRVFLWDLNHPDSAPRTNFAAVTGASSPLTVTPDGRQIGVAGADQELHLYDVETGNEAEHFDLGINPYRIEIDPSGGLLAVLSGVEVQLWDLKRRERLHTLHHTKRGTTMTWHPDGRWLAVGYDNGDVRILDFENIQSRFLTGHTRQVSDLAFDPRGEFLVSESWDSTLRLWDPGSGQQVAWTEQSGHLQVSQSGDRVALRDGRGGLVIRPVVRSSALRLLTTVTTSDADLIGLDFSHDGRWLVFGGKRGWHLWSLAEQREVAFTKTWKSMFPKFHPQGGSFVTMTTDGLLRWRLEDAPSAGDVRVSAYEMIVAAPEAEFQRFCFSQDGRWVAVAGHNRSVLIDWQNPRRRIDFSRDIAQSHVSLSPDNQWLAASSSAAGGVTIWNARDGSLQRRLIENMNAQAVISPDGLLLATTTPQECLLWDTRTWQTRQRWVLNLSGGVPVPSAFSPDGKHLALAANRTAVRLLETDTGKEAATLTAPLNQNLESLAFSADGRYLAGHTGTRVVHLWDLHALRRELARMNLDW